MAATVWPDAVPQFFTSAGAPLAGGKIYSYRAGTSTPYALYTDSALSVPFANPLVLDSAGRPSGPIFMGTTYAYKFVLTDSNDVAVGPTADNIIANASITL